MQYKRVPLRLRLLSNFRYCGCVVLFYVSTDICYVILLDNLSEALGSVHLGYVSVIIVLFWQQVLKLGEPNDMTQLSLNTPVAAGSQDNEILQSQLVRETNGRVKEWLRHVISPVGKRAMRVSPADYFRSKGIKDPRGRKKRMIHNPLLTPPDQTRLSLFEDQNPYSPPREFRSAPAPPYIHPKSQPPAAFHPTAADSTTIDLFTYDSQKKPLSSSAPVWWETDAPHEDPLMPEKDPFFGIGQPVADIDNIWLR